MYLDCMIVAEPGFFIILDFHSRERLPVETYEEMILTSDNEFLLDDFHSRSLLKKISNFLSSFPENFEYCPCCSINEHIIAGYVDRFQISWENIHPFSNERCYEFSEHFAKTAVQIESATTPERMDIFS